MSDLYIRFDEHGGTPSQYIRELDLQTAVSLVTYKMNGVTYTREYFASNPERYCGASCRQPSRQAVFQSESKLRPPDSTSQGGSPRPDHTGGSGARSRSTAHHAMGVGPR